MIIAKNIVKSFGDLKVLGGVDMEVEKSEVVAIVGASGAGKSTFLQIVGTLMKPDGGSLEIDGTDALAMNGRHLSAFRNTRLGFVFQFHHLLPEFTAVENIMIPQLIAGTPTSKAKARAIELLEEVGLKERAGHKPSELSGGEQQRVAIARAIANSPSVLLADEPSGNLDTRTKAEIHDLFFRLRNDFGQTTVIVTHDEGLAAMCDRKLVMSDGVIL